MCFFKYLDKLQLHFFQYQVPLSFSLLRDINIDINIIVVLNVVNSFPTKQYNNMLCLCTVN